jgi:hypothetical protein
MARKARSGAAPGAPKPKIVPPKTPVMRRRGVRWGVLVVAALGIAWIVMAVLGSSHRKGVLDEYDRALARAMRPYSQHQAATVPDSFVNIPQQFQQGAVTPARLRSAATTWQEDFAEAATNVRALTPPEQLRDAQEVIAQALDAHATIASQYTALADTKALELRARAAQREPLTDLVADWVAQIDKARANASALLARGQGVVSGLKIEWGLGSTPSPETSLPDGFQIPDGGAGS